MATPTPTRSLTPWISPTRTPTQVISPTRTPTRAISPTRTPTIPVEPTKATSPTTAPINTPTYTKEPTIAPTLTSIPDTSTPAPKTPTPFVTRDPTRALTPTGNYTPGSTSAPITIEPPKIAVTEAPICELTSSQLQAKQACLTESSRVVRSGERSLWQTLLDFFGLDFRRGLVAGVSG